MTANYQKGFALVSEESQQSNNIPIFLDNTDFLSFRQYAGRNSSYNTPLAVPTIARQQNTNLDNTSTRTGMINNGVGIMNNSLKNWQFASQTLANQSAATNFCTSNADCKQYGINYTCNANYQTWDSGAYGDQSGPYCAETYYPELTDGTYSRKGPNQGGIGALCSTDSDCGSEYSCKTTPDIFGSGYQLGYCSMKYTCGDDVKHLEYPMGAGAPVYPGADQNKGGAGYSTKEECNSIMRPGQQCILNDSSYFAVYPAQCPRQHIYRSNVVRGVGALATTPNNAQFSIPAFAGQKASALSSGIAPGGAANALVYNAISTKGQGEPLQYLQAINPRVTNQ